MKITNLVSIYSEQYLKKKNLALYESSFPEFFQHYFQYWGNKDFFKPLLDEQKIEKRIELIQKHLSLIETKFTDFGIDISQIELVLMVGQDTTNGHSFFHKDEYKVFLPLEGYESDEQVLVFVPHEIVHAIHYKNNPDFYFHSKDEKEKFSRLLITEGLATLLTREIMGISQEQALWADFLTSEELKKWMESCQTRESELCAYALQNFNSSSANAMFYAQDNKDIFTYRAGYYLGMKLLDDIVKNEKLSYAKLLSVKADKLLSLVKKRISSSL